MSTVLTRPSATTSTPPRTSRRRRRHRVREVLIVALTLLVIALILFPFAWMVLTSLRPSGELLGASSLWPSRLTLASYRNLFATSAFARYIVNSLVVSLAAMVIAVVISSLAGYAFSRFVFPGKRALMVAVIAVHLFPYVILITPMYSFFSELGLLNTYQGLILAYVAITLPFASYLMMGYFETVPRGLDEAARIDGCSTLGVLFRVVLPVAWPGVATVAVNAFILSWEEFLFAKVLMTSETFKTVQVGLSNFFGEFTTQWDLVMAASVVASVPTIVLLAIAQRRLVSGLAVGSVKE